MQGRRSSGRMNELEKFLDAGKYKTDQDVKVLLKMVKDLPEGNLSNEVIRHLIDNVLPQIFTCTARIRETLVELFDILEPALPKPQLKLKDEIAKYLKEVQRLYKENDRYWGRVWCILVNLVGSEIVQKDLMNAFLKIAEDGFRSNEMQKRCESFDCWKALLRLLTKYNEIKKERRVHLILIPLKGSKAKTLEIAEKKFDIWWELVQVLHDVLIEHSNTFEDFLCFALGPFKNDFEPLITYADTEMTSLAKTFPTFRDKAIVTLATCLGAPTPEISKLAEVTGLDLANAKQLITKKIFEKFWKIIIACAIEVVPLIATLSGTSNVEIVSNIWMSLLTFVGPANVTKCAPLILKYLEELQKVQKKMSTDTALLTLTIEVTTLVLSFDLIVESSTADVATHITYLDDNFKHLTDSHIERLPEAIKSKFINKTSPLRRSCRTPTKESPSPAAKKADDEFVVIKSVWKLDPEKLTEHQRERMKQRACDIPAMYNNLSQDSSNSAIKEWTPATITAVSPLKTFGKKIIEARMSPKTAATMPPPATVPPAVQVPVSPTVKVEPQTKQAKPKAQRSELERLKIDTVEGAPPISKSEKIVTRRNSISRIAKQKEPDWKKDLLPNKKPRRARKGDKKLEENSDRSDDSSASESSKAKAATPKSPIKSPLKAPNQQSPSTPAKTPPDSSDVVESSQDVTPNLNVNGRRTMISTNSPVKASLPAPTAAPASPKTPPKTEPRVLRRYTVSWDGMDRSLVTPHPEKMEVVDEATVANDVEDEKMEVSEASIPPTLSPEKPIKATDSPKREFRRGSLSFEDADSPVKSPKKSPVETENRRSPRLSPKVDLDLPISSPERPTRETTRKVMDFKNDDDNDLANLDDSNKLDSQTITSSPDQTAEKTGEFLNNTLNLSPIVKSPSLPSGAASSSHFQIAHMSPTPTTDRKLRRIESPRTTSLVVPVTTTNSIFQGRGAHMISIINKQNSSTPKSMSMFGGLNGVGGGAVGVPTLPEILTLGSKTLPLPNASPSSGILKRKMEDSFEENNPKRKRVSFHDPPVSLTKEYLLQDEEIRNNKKCKYMLKRRGKRDSNLELLQKLDSPDPAKGNIHSPKTDAPNLSQEVPSSSSASTAALSMTVENTSHNDSLYNFKTRSEVFDFCFSDGNFEEFLEKCVENGTNFTPKANKIMAKALSNQMETDSKLCYSILDRFSEKHSKEFLEHAIHENSTKDILDCVNQTAIMEYIQEKISTNQEEKVELLRKLDTWFADSNIITRQEALTFFVNSMPEDITSDELNLILDELFSDKTPRETFDILTEQMRKKF